MTAAIEISGLRKEYRRLRRQPFTALDGLDLVVPEGGVFGFLGPNGAGKTSTIRCLLGLTRITGGSCRILGRPCPEQLPSVIRNVGTLVETPGLFPGMSARRYLSMHARLYDLPETSVPRVLDEVGLTDRADDLVKEYSLGMRQRLGIGLALLKDPKLLILDEPSNGLDPAGIKEIRELLRHIGASGRTVFLSSHLLSEVEQVCDQVAILREGRCLTSGPVHEVLAARPKALWVRLDELDEGLAVLTAAGIAAERDGDGLRVNRPVEEAREISRLLAERGLYPSELRPESINLENVFLQLTDDQLTEDTEV